MMRWFRRPEPEWPRDPLLGVVSGPALVDRTRWTHGAHEARYRVDAGFPVVEWGVFSVDSVGWSYPEPVSAPQIVPAVENGPGGLGYQTPAPDGSQVPCSGSISPCGSVRRDSFPTTQSEVPCE